MSADLLLQRLQRVRAARPGSWMASCPGPLHTNGDHHPSLHITEKDSVLLLRCFSGCEVSEIVTALGLELSDLFPPTTTHRAKPGEFRAFKSDVFEQARHEIAIVWLIGCDMHKERTISNADYQRLGEAIARLERVGQAAYGS